MSFSSPVLGELEFLSTFLKISLISLISGCLFSFRKDGADTMAKKVLPGNPRQIRTNYRCSDQGLAGFACRTSTAPDSSGSETQQDGFRNAYFTLPSNLDFFTAKSPRPPSWIGCRDHDTFLGALGVLAVNV